MDFVTQRRIRRINSENDLTNLNETIPNNSTIIFDESMRSLPDVSMANNSRVIELEMQIEEIRQTLLTANKEVDVLTLENSSLKKEIENCNIVIKTLKSLQSPVSERQRCLSPKPKMQLRDKNKKQLFVKASRTNDRSTQTDTLTTLGNRKQNKRKIKLTVKPKNKYTSKSLLKKIRILKRKMFKLEKELKIIQKDRNTLQHKIMEYKTKNEIQIKPQQPSTNVLINHTLNLNRRKVSIFSDSLGSGLASRLMKLSSAIDVINYCKPGATGKQILCNFGQNTKHLQENDLAVISIGNYYSEKWDTTYYTEIIRSILSSNEKRRFNVLLGSIVYDGRNDSRIHNINKELARLAQVTEKVKYVELNNINRHAIKNLLSTEILTSCSSFNSSSSLRFIKTQENDTVPNFPRASKLGVNG